MPAEIFCATQQTPEFLLRLRDDLTRLRATLNDYMDHLDDCGQAAEQRLSRQSKNSFAHK